jgi:hypothetical protein
MNGGIAGAAIRIFGLGVQIALSPGLRLPELDFQK